MFNAMRGHARRLLTGRDAVRSPGSVGNRATPSLDDLVARSKADPVFSAIYHKVNDAKIMNWLQEEEKALHFAVGAYTGGTGSIIEIGSFQGGSACFLAAGLARRGQGRLICIDPHLGAPLWFGTAPYQHTLKIFQEKTAQCGVSDWIDVRVGESAAVAATWPAEPIDTVFIDGDHTFAGALTDFECWGPKLRPGGLVMIDDADDPSVPGLLEMIAFVKTLGSVKWVGQIQGIAVFERTGMPARAMMDELSAACVRKQVYRPWNLRPLHEVGLPKNYRASKDWADGPLDVIYQLGFLARCGAGAYGYTAATRAADRAVLQALSRDRGDGDIVELSPPADDGRDVLRQFPTRFRVLLATPEEASLYAPLLLPGGMMAAGLPSQDLPVIASGKEHFARAGLVGNDMSARCSLGSGSPIIWRSTPSSSA